MLWAKLPAITPLLPFADWIFFFIAINFFYVKMKLLMRSESIQHLAKFIESVCLP